MSACLSESATHRNDEACDCADDAGGDKDAAHRNDGLALAAFDRLLPFGGLLVTIALIPFGYSTMLSWAYYGEKCVEYLAGERSIRLFRLLFIFIVVIGATAHIQSVWSFANAMNGLMAYPNLIALFILSGVISRETKAFKKFLTN